MRCVLTASRAIERDSSSETSSVARMARPTAVPATTTARSTSTREAAVSSSSGTAAATAKRPAIDRRDRMHDQLVVAPGDLDIALDTRAGRFGYGAAHQCAYRLVARQAGVVARIAGPRLDEDVGSARSQPG